MCSWQRRNEGMVDKYKETYPIDVQQSDNEAIDAQKIFATTTVPLFHYTSREVFWKIIEDESFLARHILFSNDFEEYELGRNVIQKKLKMKNCDDEDITVANERYMVCFCEEDDLLSQWRGYAKSGIAMKFDFSLGTYHSGREPFSSYHCFTLVNSGKIPQKSELQIEADKTENRFEERYASRDIKSDDKYVTLCVTAPYKVYYIDKKGNGRELSAALKGLKQRDDTGAVAAKLIPYIKNRKFDEEKEYRLIFNLTDLYDSEMECFIGGKVEYLDINGVKKPNVRVEFGDARDCLEEKPIKVYFKNEEYKIHLDRLAEDMQQNVGSVVIEPEQVTHDALKKNEILLGNGKNQEKAAWKLYELFMREKAIFAQTKMWCDGHLPIRQIIVGPCKDEELMKKSIIQYKNNKYWMKSIDVKVSEIPYRD